MLGGRHASLQAPGVGNGLPPRSLSATTALSKVVSLNSLNSYTAHVGGALPPGETLSPPLSDSPQQLSPRELEAQRAAEAPHAAAAHYFAAGPLPSLHPQYALHQYAAAPPPMQPYGYPPPLLPHQQHAAYSNNVTPWGAADYTPPPPPGYGAQRSPAQMPNAHSWPRLHQPGYGAAGPGRQPSLGSAASPPYHAANGAAGGMPPMSGGSRHSRSDSYEQRPASASAAAMLIGRSPSPLDLHGMERLEGAAALRHAGASATPYNWQHRWVGGGRLEGWRLLPWLLLGCWGCWGQTRAGWCTCACTVPTPMPPGLTTPLPPTPACSHHPSDKIVSLSPGATEMLWALGLGARVAAVSDACDFPPDVVARAKARRSFAAASASSYASLAQLAGGSSASTASTSAGASRRESPLAAQGRSALAAWQAPGGEGGSSGGSSSAAVAGAAAAQLEDVVDEEVLARERPGLVVYEEDAGAPCASGGMYAGAPGQGGLGQAVLHVLVAVGLQHLCRVVCVRRRTLGDVLDSMLAVSGALRTLARWLGEDPHSCRWQPWRWPALLPRRSSTAAGAAGAVWGGGHRLAPTRVQPYAAACRWARRRGCATKRCVPSTGCGRG